MTSLLPILAVILLVLALVCLWLAGRRQRASGLPGGRVIYTDTRGWGPVEEPLYDPESSLTGRPDYLVQKGNQIIPVEVKSSRISDAPYDSHIFQLAAYCLLVGRVFKKRPAYGILHYPNRTFAIDFTPALEAELLDMLAEMRQDDKRKEVDRSHESPARCAACGYREICDQNLAQG